MTAIQPNMKENTMKKFLIIMLVVLFSAGTSLAAGGKNQGKTGKGSTKTGTTTQGSGSQDRTGR